MICHANSETDKVIFFHHSTGKNACLDLFAFGIGDSETNGWIFMFIAHSGAPFAAGVAAGVITRKPHVIITF